MLRLDNRSVTLYTSQTGDWPCCRPPSTIHALRRLVSMSTHQVCTIHTQAQTIIDRLSFSSFRTCRFSIAVSQQPVRLDKHNHVRMVRSVSHSTTCFIPWWCVKIGGWILFRIYVLLSVLAGWDWCKITLPRGKWIGDVTVITNDEMLLR